MAQLKNLLVNGPSKFLGPVNGARFNKPISFIDDNALPQKTLQFVVGIDSFGDGGQAGWQTVDTLAISWNSLQGAPSEFQPISHTHNASNITAGTLSVARGGTGVDNFTSGHALIGNGTSGIATRAILNNVSVGPSGWVNTAADNTQLITHNTLAYWNGAYSGTSSNLIYFKNGQIERVGHTHDYLPLSGGTLSGLLVQGAPSTDPSIANMNRFQADLFVQGSGVAPNNPEVAGFYLGKSATDENRHMDIVSGGDFSYIDFNKAGVPAMDYQARLIANVSTGLVEFQWDSRMSTRQLNIAGNLTQSGYGVLDTRHVSGTANYVPKFTGANSIGNSSIIDSTDITLNKSTIINDDGNGNYTDGLRINPVRNNAWAITYYSAVAGSTSGTHD